MGLSFCCDGRNYFLEPGLSFGDRPQIIRGDLTPLLTMSEDVETVICSFVMSWGGSLSV